MNWNDRSKFVWFVCCLCVYVRIEIVRMPLWMLHTLRWFDYGSAFENKFIQIHLKYDKCSGVSHEWVVAAAVGAEPT